MGIENIQIIETVSLDFYNNNIKTINVKQLDTDARGIKINCTEHGKKFVLNTLSHSAFVRYKKPDGNDVLNDCYIQDDGSIIFPLTQQMTVVAGKSNLDILIFCSSGLTVQDIGDITNFNDLGISTLSTMTLGLNIYPNATNLENVESSHEYDALIEGLGKMIVVDHRMSTLEQTINSNETKRQLNEEARKTDEINRAQAEQKRENDTREAIKNCNTATSSANTATKNANEAISNAQTATTNANQATESANTATENANNATTNANNAAQEVRNVLNNSGVVLKTDIVHNLETDDQNKVPDATQVRILKSMIDNLQLRLNSVVKVHFDEKEPTSDIGKDGDIYMMLIEDTDAVEVGE